MHPDFARLKNLAEQLDERDALDQALREFVVGAERAAAGDRSFYGMVLCPFLISSNSNSNRVRTDWGTSKARVKSSRPS